MKKTAKYRLFGILHGRPYLWGCFAGETRKTPPHLPIATRNPIGPKYIIAGFLALMALFLLSGCGSVSTSQPENKLANNPMLLDIEPFIRLAKNATCADQRNQLYVIDDQYVFWTTEGQCDDAGYAHTLYGITPDEKLCYLEDTFAGPQSSCESELETMFETIRENLDRPDLGLGDGYMITEVSLDKK